MAGLDPSSRTTLLILLGASSWPDAELGGSIAFEKAAMDLQAYFLSDPNGFRPPKNNILNLFNSEASNSDILNRIGSFLEERTKAIPDIRDVFVYYVGHGGITSSSSAFYLAIRNTHKEYEKATSIEIEDLAERLKKGARFQRRILILDCCFAARALPFLLQGPAPVELASRKTIAAFEEKDHGEGIPSKGTSFLASSGKDVASIVLPDETSTAFTSSLLSVLRTGDPFQERERLTLHTVHRLTRDFLIRTYGDKFPQPEIHSPDQSEGNIATTIAYFPNPRAAEVRARRVEEEQRIRRMEEEERLRLAEEAEQARKVEEEKRRRLEEERTREAEEEQVRKVREEQAHQAEEKKRRQAEEGERIRAMEEERQQRVEPKTPGSSTPYEFSPPSQPITPEYPTQHGSALKARQNPLRRFVEKPLERFVENVFRHDPLMPGYVASKLETAMEDNLLISKGRKLAPNVYDIYVSIKDHQRLAGGESILKKDWQDHLISVAKQRRYTLQSIPVLRLHASSDLRSGIVRVETALVENQQLPGISSPDASYPGHPGQSFVGSPGSSSLGAGFIGPSGSSSMPSAAPVMPQAWLTIRIPQANQQIYRIEKPVINIGRQLSNDIIVEDKRASRYVTQIKYQPNGQFAIFDLGSINGITINGTPYVRQHTLQSGDRFTIGGYDFLFERR